MRFPLAVALIVIGVLFLIIAWSAVTGGGDIGTRLGDVWKAVTE